MQVAMRGQSALNVAGGEIIDPESTLNEAAFLGREATALRQRSENLVSACRSLDLWRNGLVAAGFLLLIVARILSAYE